MVAEFVAIYKGEGQYWRFLMKDYPKMIHENDRFAKRILSHDYGEVIAKQFRDFARKKVGFVDGAEEREENNVNAVGF